MRDCQGIRSSGAILCVKRGHPCFNSDMTPDQCQRCQAGEDVQPTLPAPLPQAAIILLPPYKAGRDRKVQIEPDGTILYEIDDKWPEPPKDITGYERDPNNPLRFTSKWLPCHYRIANAVRFANCGCLGIISRCNCPQAAKFADRVDDIICAACPVRIKK